MKLNQKKVDEEKLVKQFDVAGSSMNQRASPDDYDYESVMHYPGGGFMQATKEPVSENTERMGWYFAHGEEMSPKDKKKLVAVYSGVSSGKHAAMKLSMVPSTRSTVHNQKMI